MNIYWMKNKNRNNSFANQVDYRKITNFDPSSSTANKNNLFSSRTISIPDKYIRFLIDVRLKCANILNFLLRSRYPI